MQSDPVSASGAKVHVTHGGRGGSVENSILHSPGAVAASNSFHLDLSVF